MKPVCYCQAVEKDVNDALSIERVHMLDTYGNMGGTAVYSSLADYNLQGILYYVKEKKNERKIRAD